MARVHVFCSVEKPLGQDDLFVWTEPGELLRFALLPFNKENFMVGLNTNKCTQIAMVLSLKDDRYHDALQKNLMSSAGLDSIAQDELEQEFSDLSGAIFDFAQRFEPGTLVDLSDQFPKLLAPPKIFR